jgi:L-malate glycosyltransferase
MPEVRILHIDTGHAFRGGQRQVVMLADRLHRLGMPQVIACPPDGGIADRLSDIPTVELSRHSLIRKLHLRPLRNAVLEHRLTIVHAHDSDAHTLGMLLKIAIPPLKLVVTRRVVFPPRGLFGTWFKYRHHVDRFIAISGPVADALSMAGVDRDRIAVIPSGIDWPAVASAPCGGPEIDTIAAKYKHLVVTAGALTAEKDFGTAIRVMELVHAEVPDAGMIILGEGPERNALEAMIAERDIDYVHLLGHREPIASIFKVCRLFLLTSRWEGLNTSAIEAAACGLPLVVSDTGGLPEVVENGVNGVLCSTGNPAGYAAAVVDLLTRDDTRNRMAAEAEGRARRFDIEKVIPETVDLYKRVLGTR